MKGLKANHSSMDVTPLASGGNITGKFSEVRLYCYSANDNQGVSRVMTSHIATLDSTQKNIEEFLRNYSYTLGCRRSNLEYKGFIVAASAADLVNKIRGFDMGSVTRSLSKSPPNLGFIFCGQGAQWAQMGKDLMSFNVYSTSLKEASCFLEIALGSRFDLLKEILRGVENTRISDPEISQPATTALQVALVDLLKSFGIQPKCVVGHSSGEIAAAYASGAISRYDAWKIAYYRGLAAASIPVRAPKLRGGMMVVGMSIEEVSEYLARLNKSVQVACINSPRSITISGQADAIEFIAGDLRQRKIFNKVLNVKVAYHSSHMKLVEHDYADALADIVADKCFEGVTMISSVTGKQVTGNELNAKYWADNLVSPVQYVAAIQSMMKLPGDNRPDILIELGPSAALRSPTADILATLSNGPSPMYHSALEQKQDGTSTLLNLLGTLWSRAYPLDMKNVISKGHQQDSLRCLSNLPSYPWDHSKKYWHETDMSLENRLREYPRMDLIGHRVIDSVGTFEPRWRGFLRLSENPWIQDHQVQKTIVYPASGMVAMVLEGARQLAKSTQNLLGYELLNMKLEKAMTIPDTAYGLEVSLNIRNDPDSTDDDSKVGSKSFVIYSRLQGRPWDRHASGQLHFHYKVGNWQAAFRRHEGRHNAMSETCKESMIPRQLYEHLDSIGMNYGPLFQNIVEVRKGDSHCVSRVKIPNTLSKMPCQFEYPHLIHPATLDAMIHTLLAIEQRPMVPVFIKSLFVTADLDDAESGTEFAGYSLANATSVRSAEATVFMKQTARDQACVIIEGIKFAALPCLSPEEGGFLPSNRNLCSQIIWKQDATYARPKTYCEQVAILAHKYPGLSILQIGGGYQLSQATLKTIAPEPNTTPQLLRYTIVEVEGDDAASQTLAFVKDTILEPFIETVSDVSSSKNDYHLIVACDDSALDTSVLKKKLKVGGILLTQAHVTEDSIPLEMDRARGTSDREYTISYSNQAFKELIQYTEGDNSMILDVHRDTQPFSFTPVVVLTLSERNEDVQAYIDHIMLMEGSGFLFTDVSILTVDKMLEDPTVLNGKTVVSLLDFSGDPSQDRSVFDWKQSDFDCFHALQHHAKNILWVTRGAHMGCKNPRGSPIVGLARTLISEDPLKSFATFDLAAESSMDSCEFYNNIIFVLDAAFGSHPASMRETEFAEDAGNLYIPRLSTIRSINSIIEGENSSTRLTQKSYTDNPGLQLMIGNACTSDEDLFFIKSELQDLKADEVEIAFKEAPLSLLDLETVFGRAQGTTVGADIKGQVTRVGSEVSGLSPGDNVVALVADGAIRNVLRVKSQFVKRVDADIIPSFLISAYFALVHIGRTRRGSKVLIHAGAGAFGLVAIDLAISIGAEVFATVVGPEADRQREILERRGVLKDHILGADSGLFVADLLGSTNGKGVDCVFNPTLESFDAQFDCVRRCES